MLLLLLLIAVVHIQSPRVQTAVAHKVVEMVQEKTGVEMGFSSIAFRPFNALVVKDMVILDSDPCTDAHVSEPQDTLAYVGNLVATLSLRDLLKDNCLHIKEAFAEDVYFAYVQEDREEYPSYKSNLERIFKLEAKPEKESSFVLMVDNAEVHGARYRMQIVKPEGAKVKGGMNWYDLDLTADATVSDIRYSDKTFTCSKAKASTTERSGYSISRLSADEVLVGRGITEIKGMHLQDKWSDMRMPRYAMLYSSAKTFSHYVDSVRMEGCLAASRVAMKTISKFALGAFEDNNITLDVTSGCFGGTVDNLGVDNITFEDAYSGIAGKIHGTLTGLPKIEDARLDASADRLTFTADQMLKFVGAWAPDLKVNLGDIAKGRKFVTDAKVTGGFNNMGVDATIHEGAGSLKADLKLKNLIDRKAAPVISGKIATTDLDVGGIAGIDAVEDCTLRGAFEAQLTPGNPSLRLDSLRVSHIKALGYDYHDLAAMGTFSQSAFDGRIICSDPNLHFAAQGLFNLSRKTQNAAYDFAATLGLADLHALGLDPREPSRVSLPSIKANFIRTSTGDLIGRVDARKLSLTSEGGQYDLGDVSIDSHSNGDVHRIKLASSFAQASYVASAPLSTFISDIKALTVGKELPSLLKEEGEPYSGATYDIDASFLNTSALLSFAAPGAFIADSTRVTLDISRDGALTGALRSGRLAYKEKYLKGMELTLDNEDEALHGRITADEVQFTDGLRLKNNTMLVFADNDRIGARYLYDNHTEPDSKGELCLTGSLGKDEHGHIMVEAATLPTEVSFDGSLYEITESVITYKDGEIGFNGFAITSDEQSVRIDGIISSEKEEKLTAVLDHVDLDLVNAFINDLDLGGQLSGTVEVLSPTTTGLGVTADLVSEQSIISDLPAGDIYIKGDLDRESRKISFNLKNYLGGKSTIKGGGTYALDGKSVDGSLSLDGLELGYASGLLKSVFSELEGKLSGDITFAGPLNNLKIGSRKGRISSGMLKVDYTNVPYYVDGPFRVTEEGLFFENVSARDRYRGTGSINGGILFGGFKDIAFDIRMMLENMECIDIDRQHAAPIYGSIFGTGHMNISGPINKMLMEADATTVGSGDLHIPVANMTSTGGTHLLTFKEPEKEVFIDPYEQMMHRIEKEKKSSELEFKLKVNATPEVRTHLELDSTGDIGMDGSGAGTISLDIKPGTFAINGDYTLNQGTFNVALMGLMTKSFTINNGSSIKFNGDIMESDLSINGQYSTKAALSGLIADSSSVRRPVNCLLGITDKLKNPKLSFNIEVPDIDPTTRTMVEGALNNEEQIMKQFASLLLTGSFLPDDQSGIVNNTSAIYSNVTGIMANQINNVLEKLEIPIDLGLNYQPNQGGTDIFDVAVSTQLFNNRVVVNGTIGNRDRQYSTSNNNSDLVGDLDIEIKLDNSGRMRLTIFSHSADGYTSFLDDSQRNGMGVAYQKEFNSFREFFSEMVMTRQARAESATAKALQKEDTVIIHID